MVLPHSPENQLLCSLFQGILSDDRGLAAALWRTFFNQKCEDPRQLELLVEYVRKQVSSPSTPLQSFLDIRASLRSENTGLSKDHERLSSQSPSLREF